jgi:hypothetical protein
LDHRDVDASAPPDQRNTQRSYDLRRSQWAVTEGAGHVIIESGDAATDGRDKATLLDTHRNDGGVPFTYTWATKAEPLLWLADAIAGAVGEHSSARTPPGSTSSRRVA